LGEVVASGERVWRVGAEHPRAVLEQPLELFDRVLDLPVLGEPVGEVAAGRERVRRVGVADLGVLGSFPLFGVSETGSTPDDPTSLSVGVEAR
jgi:hypothetical protein